MNTAFLIVTVLFMLVSLGMVLIILVQRPSGGGLAGAFGGAGGSGSDTVFGGRVGDALTWATVVAFLLYLGFAIALNLLDEVGPAVTTTPPGTTIQAPAGGTGGTGNSSITPIELGDGLIEILGEDSTGEQKLITLPEDDLPDDEADSTTEDPANTDPPTEDPPKVDPPGGDN